MSYGEEKVSENFVVRGDSGFYRTTAPDVMLSIVDKIIVFDNSYGLGLFGNRLESKREESLGVGGEGVER